MKTLMFITLVTVAVMCCPRQCHAQGTLAPLYLLTSGSGSITPLHNGELLDVGTNYTMTAIPDSNFAFNSWQPVDVFLSVSLVTNNGTVYGTTNTVFSPLPGYTVTSSLTFTMQPQQTLSNNTFLSAGWRANFVPVPEPTTSSLVACGLAMVLLHWRGAILRTQPFGTPHGNQQPPASAS